MELTTLNSMGQIIAACSILFDILLSALFLMCQLEDDDDDDDDDGL